jgi:O-antigen/teichoic acid export membrane protein
MKINNTLFSIYKNYNNSIISLLSKLVIALSNLIIIIVIGIKFNQTEQGIYYAFISIIAIKIFLELGLGVVVVSFLSHEWPKLSLNSSREVVGDEKTKIKFFGIIKFYYNWNFFAGFFTCFTCIIVGIIFFRNSEANINTINWLEPWILFCCLSGIGIITSSIWPILEGTNQFRFIYIGKLIQALIATAVTIIAILNDYGLWSLTIYSVIEILISILITLGPFKKNIDNIIKAPPYYKIIKWKIEILPMQWRIAISWISGYLTFYLFTPVLFFYHGPEIAGQMGMTLAINNGIVALFASIISPQFSIMGNLIAIGSFSELEAMRLRITKIFKILGAVSCFIAWIVVLIINMYDLSISKRVLDPISAGILCLATFLLITTLPISSYLRAHKKDPIYLISLVGGILNAVFIILGGKFFSANGQLVCYLIIIILQYPFIYNKLKNLINENNRLN